MHVSALHYDRHWKLGSLPSVSRNGMFIEWVGKNKTVLELGCATGFLSRHLAANGCAVTGVEYDPASAELARSACREVIVADLNGNWSDRISRQFDVITFGDVLEHLIDPVKVLRDCRSLVAPQGRIIISLPNVAFLSNRLNLLRGKWDYTETGILDRTHLKFFTYKSAQSLVEQAGYSLERIAPISGLRGTAKLPFIVLPLTRMFPGLFGFQFLLEISAY